VLETLNILVVDDDEAILDLFKEALEREESYNVWYTKDGVEAFSIIEKKVIDCCLIDLHMPNMNGIDLIKKIRDYDNTISMIVLTGYPSMENVIAALRYGVADFLIKPVRIKEIKTVIKRVLENRRVYAENIVLKEEIKKKRNLERLNEELTQKVNELKILNRIMQELEGVHDSNSLFNLIVNLTVEIICADEAYFYIINKTMERPFCISSLSRDEEKGQLCNGHDLNRLLFDLVNDGIPLLIPENRDNGFFCRDIFSLIAVPLKIKNKVFGVLLAVNIKNKFRFTKKDLYYMDFISHRASLTIENMALYESIYQNLFSTLYAFVEAIEVRDPYTKQHSSRVTHLALKIGEEIGCSQGDLDILNFSGLLHDIGKIGIRDNILLKPGPLTEEEREVIKKHPVIGANIVGHLGLWKSEQEIICHHHERWDGMGYPDGLSGNSIPLLSRILAVADVYDALTSDRAYRKKLSPKTAIDIILKGSGTQFDPEIVKVFLSMLKHDKRRKKSIFTKKSIYLNTPQNILRWSNSQF